MNKEENKTKPRWIIYNRELADSIFLSDEEAEELEKDLEKQPKDTENQQEQNQNLNYGQGQK